jgi:hypothetical protein
MNKKTILYTALLALLITPVVFVVKPTTLFIKHSAEVPNDIADIKFI